MRRASEQMRKWAQKQWPARRLCTPGRRGGYDSCNPVPRLMVHRDPDKDYVRLKQIGAGAMEIMAVDFQRISLPVYGFQPRVNEQKKKILQKRLRDKKESIGWSHDHFTNPADTGCTFCFQPVCWLQVWYTAHRFIAATKHTAPRIYLPMVHVEQAMEKRDPNSEGKAKQARAAVPK